MPELPEVETVKETLKKQILYKKIKQVEVYYESMIEFPSISEFKKRIQGQTIQDMMRRGKWLIFVLDQDVLLSHLRMEGKYLLRTVGDKIEKHEHVAIQFTDQVELRYRDTRKFGRMYLLKKEEMNTRKPLSELGLEPWDSNLNSRYLKEKYEHKRLPIKEVLLDQTIITGIGNIYADEILFLSKINPLSPSCQLTRPLLDRIITNTRDVLSKAIEAGGTTIRTYTSSEGVHGRFQQELFVHGRENEPCPVCGTIIIKIKVGGRGTYYCKRCQK